MSSKINKICHCGKSFTVAAYRKDTAKSCSRSCANLLKVGKPNTSSTKFSIGHTSWLKGTHIRNNPAGEFKKGLTPWNKGVSTHMVPWNKGEQVIQMHNEKHPAWKGEAACYAAKHSWVRRKLGTPLMCSKCKKTGGTTYNYHWSNISGNYLRDLTDWERLCVSCHKFKDLARKKKELTNV